MNKTRVTGVWPTDPGEQSDRRFPSSRRHLRPSERRERQKILQVSQGQPETASEVEILTIDFSGLELPCRYLVLEQDVQLTIRSAPGQNQPGAKQRSGKSG